MSWPCFMVDPVDEQEAWLRCHADGPCPSMPGEYSYHDAAVHVGRIPVVYGSGEGERTRTFIEDTPIESFKGDERWPTRCECGYEFALGDRSHVLCRQLWRLSGDDEVRIIDPYWRNPDAVPTWGAGAMFYAWWLDDWGVYRGPDGRCLSVVLPPDNTIWHIDGPSSSGGNWTRSGEPPLVTVSPSILTSRYHGFLQGGVLTDSLPDRPL